MAEHKKVAKTDESHILLVGNGINTENRLEWKKLLKHIQDDVADNNQANIDVENSEISSILLYDYLAINSKERVAKLALDFSKNTSKGDSALINKIWDIYDVVLTTNFDKTLSISEKDLYANLAKKRRSNLSRRLEFQHNNRLKKLYYIHGYYESSESICLGLEQYVDSLISIYNRVKGKVFLKKSVTRTWVDYFFMPNTTIDILGFGFSDAEIELWWLLEQRASFIKQGLLKNNNVRFFDFNAHTHDSNKNDDKNLLLEAFCSEVPVNYVSIEKTEESEKYKSFYKSVIDTLSKEA